jgi:hypothetical protein
MTHRGERQGSSADVRCKVSGLYQGMALLLKNITPILKNKNCYIPNLCNIRKESVHIIKI